MKFYKFINKTNNNLKNRNYKFKFGLNIIDNFDNSLSCTKNAFYFSDKENIHKYTAFGNTIFKISIPENAIVINLGDKYKTNKLILEEEATYDFMHKVYFDAVKSDGFALKFVPKEHKTIELCAAAVNADCNALHFVPKEYKTFGCLLL